MLSLLPLELVLFGNFFEEDADDVCSDHVVNDGLFQRMRTKRKRVLDANGTWALKLETRQKDF